MPGHLDAKWYSFSVYCPRVRGTTVLEILLVPMWPSVLSYGSFLSQITPSLPDVFSLDAWITMNSWALRRGGREGGAGHNTSHSNMEDWGYTGRGRRERAWGR